MFQQPLDLLKTYLFCISRITHRSIHFFWVRVCVPIIDINQMKMNSFYRARSITQFNKPCSMVDERCCEFDSRVDRRLPCKAADQLIILQMDAAKSIWSKQTKSLANSLLFPFVPFSAMI